MKNTSKANNKPIKLELKQGSCPIPRAKGVYYVPKHLAKLSIPESKMTWLHVIEDFAAIADYPIPHPVRYEDPDGEICCVDEEGKEHYYTEEPLLLGKALLPAYAEKLRRVVRSQYQAFFIWRAKKLELDSSKLPRGGVDKFGGLGEKLLALREFTKSKNLNFPRMQKVVSQAVRDNDVKFLRALCRAYKAKAKREKLTVDDFPLFRAGYPELSVDALLISFWAPSDLRMTWADHRIPPLCMWHPDTLPAFFDHHFEHNSRDLDGYVKQAVSRLGLKLLKADDIKPIKMAKEVWPL